jgi:hypothetical protein
MRPISARQGVQVREEKPVSTLCRLQSHKRKPTLLQESASINTQTRVAFEKAQATKGTSSVAAFFNCRLHQRARGSKMYSTALGKCQADQLRIPEGNQFERAAVFTAGTFKETFSDIEVGYAKRSPVKPPFAKGRQDRLGACAIDAHVPPAAIVRQYESDLNDVRSGGV